MLKRLYVRLVLWVIRPALERRENETAPHLRAKVQDIVFDGIVGPGSKGGLIDTALHSAYGLKRK